MQDQPMCDVCGIRPATVTIRRIGPGNVLRTEHLCDIHAVEARQRSGGRRPSLFDNYFQNFFENEIPDSYRETGFPFQEFPSTDRQVEEVDITRFFSEVATESIQRAAQYAQESGSSSLLPTHLLQALLDDENIRQLMQKMRANPEQIKRELEKTQHPRNNTQATPKLTPESKNILLRAFEEARELNSSYIGPEHIFMALITDAGGEAAHILQQAGIEYKNLHKLLEDKSYTSTRNKKSQTPTLDLYCRDLTQLAREGKLDPVIGRADEIETTIEVLSRRTKNNPVLIGEPGVGKTVIIEGIAQRIVNDDVSENLAERRILQLDLTGMVAGTQYRGQFEERIKKVLDEARSEQDHLLLFIDEVHTVVGTGAAEGSMDVANILKPALARGEIRLIGATTLNEYRKYIEKDAALERRFQPVIVSEPSTEEAILILRGLSDRYEAYHKVKIEEKAIVAAVELSDRYIQNRHLPDKAIDLLDQAAARVSLRNKTKPSEQKNVDETLQHLQREKDQALSAEDYTRAQEIKERINSLNQEKTTLDKEKYPEPTVTEEDIASIVNKLTHIPVSKLTEEENTRLLQLENILHQRVIGQDEAVKAVSAAVRRSRTGLADPDRPMGSFLFLGPTGVGKTEMARALTEAIFDDENAMIRFDMSEYQERYNVSRLIGSPPGYVGYEEAGQLTEAIRRRPYSLILLDEIEKAHPDVLNILLQVLEDGRLTDGQGRIVNMKNTLVIMTSNMGATHIQKATREHESFEKLKTEVMDIVQHHLPPELLNRIDDTILFHALDQDEIHTIVRLFLKKTQQRLKNQDITLDVTDAAVFSLSRQGFNPEFGARPLRRVIQRTLDNKLSEMMLDGSLKPHMTVRIDSKDDQFTFNAIQKESVKQKEEAMVGSQNKKRE